MLRTRAESLTILLLQEEDNVIAVSCGSTLQLYRKK